MAEEDILDDYELTSRYRTPDRVDAVMDRLRNERGVAPEVAAGILRTPRWAMQSALAEVGGRYGGISGYLAGPGGMDPSVPEVLPLGCWPEGGQLGVGSTRRAMETAAVIPPVSETVA